MRRSGPWGRYLANGSLVESLDPRVKVGSFFVLLVALALSMTFLSLAVAAVVLALALRLARIPAPYLLGRLRPFVPIVIFTFLVNFLFTPGTPLFGWAPPWGGLSTQGVVSGFARAIQLVLMLSLVVLALSAATPLEMVEGVEGLFAKSPSLRRRAREAATPVLLAFRFLPVLLEEADEIRRAQRMRGALAGKGVRDRIRGAFAILTPVFLATLRRGEALALALDARGYGVAVDFSRDPVLPLAVRDYAALLAALAALGATLVLRIAR